MNLSSLGVDLYQLATLVTHASLGRLDHRLGMSFFFRELPPRRNYVVFAGLRQILEWCQGLGFDDEDLAVLENNEVLGPALGRHPEVLRRLREVRGFVGEIRALAEGTLAFAGAGTTTSGEALVAAGAPVSLHTPLLQVETDLLRAKLLETPWLSRLNHLSMVASKAARVVTAAGAKPVLEFGQRRTHPVAALDVAYAAHLAGCAVTSNVAAEARYGIPSRGTMDHFAVQASEEPGVPPAQTERSYFEAFARDFPEASTLLVDTYDTAAGVRSAARATRGRLQGVRLDSSVSPEAVREARRILDEEGAVDAKIFVSDSLDEWRVAELAAAGADAFGVGERIACSPDAARGIGAVGKIVVNGYGKMTMKLADGSGKATLPGLLQAWRSTDHDLIALADEPGPPGCLALLGPVWRGDRPCEIPPLGAARAHVRTQLEALPAHLRALGTDHGRPWPLVASDRLVDLIRRLAKEALG